LKKGKLGHEAYEQEEDGKLRKEGEQKDIDRSQGEKNADLIKGFAYKVRRGLANKKSKIL